jgi:sugar lactone lactonase YvrE
MRRYPIAGLALAAALAACGGGDDDDDGDGVDDGGELTTEPPTGATMIASGGFTDPMDAVASPEGDTFYFSAFTAEASPRPGIFSVAAAGGGAELLVAGPPLENPAGLLLSADGSTLYVADIGLRAGELGEDGEDTGQSVMYTLATGGGALTPLASDGIAEAAGLALGPDRETLHVTGFTAERQPALFTLPSSGGSASVVLAGAPLESPSGVYVDAESVAWVMDHHPSRGLGGALWAIDSQGEATEVVSGLGLSQPAGVSLVAGGGTAVIPNRTEDGAGQLLNVNIASGAQTVVETTMTDPAGIRTAREAGVFAVVDSEAGRIYRAE